MNSNLSSGSISRTLIILAVVVLLAIIVVYGGIKIATTKKTNTSAVTSQITQEPPKPVYETQVGDVKFVMESSQYLGNILKAKTQNQQDIITTERFIKVTVGAQNKGKNELDAYTWDLGNLIDSDGRNFIPITNKAYFFLPKPDLCGAVLKPEFDPTPCVRMYEVSKVSKNLKLEVIAQLPNSNKKQTALLDVP